MSQLPPSDPSASPVFAHARGLDGRIASQASPAMALLGVAAVAVLGVVVFVSLQNGRTHRAAAARPPAAAVANAPAPALPPPAPPQFANVQQPAPPPLPAAALQPAAIRPVPVDSTVRFRAPTLVVDFSGARDAAAPSAQTVPARGAPGVSRTGPGDDKRSADDRLIDDLSSPRADTARAFQLANPSRTAAQGTVIPAVLETAIDSNLPGFARAVVSRDVRAFDGKTVLIPRGSKLIGQYRSAVAAGQSRAFVVWSRVLTPDGVSIDVSSPAADPLGRAGVPGEVDSQFFRRFGASILLSVLGGGLDALAAEKGGATAIVIGSPIQANRLAELALESGLKIQPVIRVSQGEPIRVFVARDLDFSTVAP